MQIDSSFQLFNNQARTLICSQYSSLNEVFSKLVRNKEKNKTAMLEA